MKPAVAMVNLQAPLVIQIQSLQAFDPLEFDPPALPGLLDLSVQLGGDGLLDDVLEQQVDFRRRRCHSGGHLSWTTCDRPILMHMHAFLGWETNVVLLTR